MLPSERRNDLGTKISWTILVALIGILLSMFLNFTYGMSKDAMDKSTKNSESIIRLEQCYLNTESKISEIRDIQKSHLDVSTANNVEIQKIIQILKKK